MKKLVTLALNPIEPSSWTQHEVEDIRQFLTEQFEEWPSTARIYHKHVSSATDVTPASETDIERLAQLEGPFYVIVYPADPVTIIIAIIAVVVVAAVVLLAAAKTQPPTPTIRNTQSTSPNNELSERSNKPRPNSRIPDIYGTVRSTPDLLAVPYKIYESHEEVEYAFMCIGRGSYEVSDIRDDTTLASDIAGTSVEIYAPYTSPNSGGTPQLRVGVPISTPVYNVSRSNAVNGQVLRSPNNQTLTGSSNIRFVFPNVIETTAYDFTDKFNPGDPLTISGTGAYALEGDYIIVSVSDTSMSLADPASVNANWSGITTTSYISPTLASLGPKWVGPFVLDTANLTQVFANFVAVNGLYKDDGTNQIRMDVTLEIELTPINPDGSIRGSAETFQAIVEGSATYKNTRAVTLKATPTFTGLCKVRGRRVTNSDLAFSGTVIDEIKWRDVYGVSPVNLINFGDVTTVQSVTYATAGALSIKERKLNMLVTRKLRRRVTGSTFTNEVYPTRNAAEIISAVCLDPRIGNRQPSEIDFDNIYSTVAEVQSYFGLDVCGEFSYTFDTDNLSFEETVKAIGDAVFCTAYRRGNVIKLSFEKATQDSTLLFNHRNKLPGSETRSISFGTQNNYDGVSYQYADPDDDALVTYYIPTDLSAINPKKVESLGVRSKAHAYFHAWRIWNKLQHQNVMTEFTATQEADLLVVNDRVLVADNTRPNTQDGEVDSQNVLELTLSQNVDLTQYPSNSIFLQLPDGTVESIPVIAGTNSNQVILNRAPRLPLALDDDLYARTTYIITGDADPREQAFLISEKTPQDNFSYGVRAVNYDSRYYSKDTDFINSVININGDIV